MALHRESTVATQNTTLFFKALSSSKQFLFAFRARGNLSFLFYCYVWELWQNMISCAWTLMSPGFRRMWKISILFSLQILSSFKQKKRGKRIESSWFVRLRIDRAINWHECHLLWSKKRNVNLRSARFFMLWVPFIFSWFLKNKDGNKDGNDVKSRTRIVVNTFICTYLPKERLRKKASI